MSTPKTVILPEEDLKMDVGSLYRKIDAKWVDINNEYSGFHGNGVQFNLANA